MKKQFVVYLVLMALSFTFAGKSFAAQENVTVTFYQAKLTHVLQSLSRMTGIRMITSSELGERSISAYLDNVPAEEAIDSILKANSLERERIPGSEIFVVKELPEAYVPTLSSETFFLQHAKADELGKVLLPLVGNSGKVVVDTRTNSITIRETVSSMDELRSIIKALDRTVPQVSIEAVLVELTTDSLKDLGIRWNLEGNFFGPAHDVATPWRKNPDFDIVGPRTGLAAGDTASTSPQFIMGRLSFQALTANLRLLEEKGEANILANPRITTLNDSPATIKITKNMAVAPRITETQEGGRRVTEYEYRDVGVSLMVVPSINAMGDIVLDIEPTVSSAVRSSVFEDAVDTHERTAQTRVMARDGDTIVIGGLLRKDTTARKSKVPVLGDILPFIFSRTDDQVGKTDLVIFLTPRIVTAQQARSIAEEEKQRFEIE